MEEGHGEIRDPYLKEMDIKTYLVIDPRVSVSCMGRVEIIII